MPRARASQMPASQRSGKVKYVEARKVTSPKAKGR